MSLTATAKSPGNQSLTIKVNQVQRGLMLYVGRDGATEETKDVWPAQESIAGNGPAFLIVPGDAVVIQPCKRISCL